MYSDFIDAIRHLTLALEPKRIEWAVSGAVAANLYRDQVRSTSDLDVMVVIADKSIDVVTEALHQHGWTSTNVLDGWLIRAATPEGERLDVLVCTTEYERGAIARARKFELGGDRQCKTLAVEDVLILKLIADRFQDNADVESILATQPELDWEYMSQWLEEFDLEERLQRIEDSALAAGRLPRKIRRETNRGSSTTKRKGHTEN